MKESWVQAGNGIKVVCVIDSLGSGGAQRQMVVVARGLKERGHDVSVFTYYDDPFFRKDLEQAGVRIELWRKPHRFSLAPVMALRRLVRRVGATVVLAYLETPSVYSELACLGLRDVGVVVSERNTVYGQGVSIARRAKSRLHQLATRVVTNCHAQRAWLGSRFPYLKMRLVTVWNGVDLERFQPGGERPPGSRTRLVGVGRVTAQKNLIRLAEALGKCKERGLDISVDWVGRVDDETYFKKLMLTIEACGSSMRLRWLGQRQDVPKLLRRYDAMVLPSLWEGLPNVVCEALASGLPVLAGHVSDNPILVQHGATGLIFDPERVESMVEAFETFVGLGEDEIQRWRANARRFAEDRLSMERCVTEYEELLRGSSLGERGLSGHPEDGKPACG